MAVARAVVGTPSILLADEPTGNLDSGNAEAVMGLMGELHNEGATICMVTHDPRWAGYADRTINLFDGRVVEDDVLADQQLVHHVAVDDSAAADAPAEEAASEEPAPEKAEG